MLTGRSLEHETEVHIEMDFLRAVAVTKGGSRRTKYRVVVVSRQDTKKGAVVEQFL